MQSFCHVACLIAVATAGAIQFEYLIHRKSVYNPLKVFVCIDRKCAFALIKHIFAWNAFHKGELLFGYTKCQKVGVGDFCKEPKILNYRGNGFTHFLNIKYLYTSGTWVDSALLSLSPIICLVVMVNPKKQIYSAFFLPCDNTAIGVIYSHGADFAIRSIIDFFIIDARSSRVITEFIDKIRYLSLNLPWQRSKRRQKV